MNTIQLNTIGLDKVQLPKVVVASIVPTDDEVHNLHYLLSNGGHYITIDKEYYQCMEII